MISAAFAALPKVLSPPFRRVLWKMLAMTLLLLALLWFGLRLLIEPYLAVENSWLAAALSVGAGAGLVFILGFLIAPASAFVASFFLDELAEIMERGSDPPWPAGRPVPSGPALWLAARFALAAVAVNLVALTLLLIPGVNAIAFLGANAYLLGREYFELAAMRYRSVEEASALRRANRGYLFLAGLPIALLLAVPVVNLLTPLFGAAYMVQVHKRLSGGRPPSALGR